VRNVGPLAEFGLFAESKGAKVFKQAWLPGFPEGMQPIGKSAGILEKDGQVTYLVGSDNYFSHPSGDQAGRRFALASLMDNGHVKACELERSLGIPHRTLMNWVAQCRESGPSSFFRQAVRRKPRIMTADKSAECARLLGEGKRPAEAARLAGVQESTLRKAIARQGVPKLPAAEADHPTPGRSKSERSRADAEAAAGMGTACTRADERIQAAMGLAAGATTRFEAGHDVALAGLLAGLPALCANGLLSGLGRYLKLPQGFYSALHILLVLGFMALGRIRRPEGLRHLPPGELGKVIGLDRVPEVRTLREKVRLMAQTGNPSGWMKELAKTWMESEPEAAGYLYVDGHVRVYHGAQANLPRRYVSRERLCLRGTTDYWVNDALGRPFFVVSKALNNGLADSLLTDIVPELLTSVPGQPTADELAADPSLHRFVIVFDREGATHRLLSALWRHRIGGLTYRKNVKDVWPESEFQEQEVLLPEGGSTRMPLALRETRLGAGDDGLPVTEVRRLTPTGHQTAVITTARHLGNTVIAGRMFARWCQENFFAYMMEHFDIDGLLEYGAEAIPGTLEVVNPPWRDLDKAVRQTRQKERKRQAELAKLALGEGTEIQKNAESVEALQAVQAELEQLRAQRKATPRKVTIDSLPDAERPTQLRPLNKMLADTVKMIAYRAETAMVALLRRHLKKEDEARALIRALFVSSGDIEPDEVANTLTVSIHRMASPVHDRAIAALLDELTQQEFHHPETGAKMKFMLV
jgi:DNA-binding CsgD family transcriptional regulator